MTRLRSFPRGGVRLSPHKEHTSPEPISNAALPSMAVIPMRQHAGEPAECLVKAGDIVKEGMLIGKARGEASANVHASIPGRVSAVGEIFTASGEKSVAVFIQLEGEFHTGGGARRPAAWEGMSPGDLIHRIRAAGVVGMGGDFTPTHLKLSTARKGAEVLVANGVECEPYISSDHRLMKEKTTEIVEGMRIVQRIITSKRTILALSEDTRDVSDQFMGIFIYQGPQYRVEVLSRRFPQGEESRLAKTLALQGAVVMNVATLYAIWEAVALDKPVIERVVTVAGPLVRHPRNLKVRIGTPVADLFDECGDLPPGGATVVLGGAMRGRAQVSLDVPVTKAVEAVLAFPRRAVRELPCVRCGRCIDVCPWALDPQRLYMLLSHGDRKTAEREGLSHCRECGCCSYACPSRLPLTEVFKRSRSQAVPA